MLTLEEKQFRAQLISELRKLNNNLEQISKKLDDTCRDNFKSSEVQEG